jgi:hypothetical protein
MKAFEYVNQHCNANGIEISLSFGTKAENSPLQAADVLAYEGSKFLRDPARPPRRSWLALEPDKTIISHRFGNENMAELIAELKSFWEQVPASK